MDAAERRIGARAATALLLVEGYCSLAIEMIALRVLAPVAGQSVGVTGIVVTAFLAALALGYRDGGRHRGPAAEKVARSLAGAAAWSAFWLSRFGVALAFGATARLPPLVQVAVYALVAVAPAAYLLAQTVVLLVGCQRAGGAPGKAGAAFSASTLGNVAGGLLTALVVMQHLGVAAAVLSVAGLLVFASLHVRRRPGWRLWAAGVVAGFVGGANLAVERNELVLSTAHADYAVEEYDDGVRYLRVNGQNASREDGGGIGHPYIERIEDAVYADAGGLPARVLVIGAGGFTFGRGRPEDAAEIVYVDVDVRLDEVARAFLRSLPPGGAYVAMDGRAYLLRDGPAYDAIVMDAFADRTTTPAAPAHARLLRAGALQARGGGWNAVHEPHRAARARPAFGAGGPHAAVGVRLVRDGGCGRSVAVAEPDLRVPAQPARRRRDGVFGRPRARRTGRAAGTARRGRGREAVMAAKRVVLRSITARLLWDGRTRGGGFIPGSRTSSRGCWCCAGRAMSSPATGWSRSTRPRRRRRPR